MPSLTLSLCSCSTSPCSLSLVPSCAGSIPCIFSERRRDGQALIVLFNNSPLVTSRESSPLSVSEPKNLITWAADGVRQKSKDKSVFCKLFWLSCCPGGVPMHRLLGVRIRWAGCCVVWLDARLLLSGSRCPIVRILNSVGLPSHNLAGFLTL